MSNTPPKAFVPLKPIVWSEHEIIEGVKYKVPDKIPANATMQQEVTLRDRFKEENPDRKASEFGIWLDYEVTEKTKTLALYENIFVETPNGKPVAYMVEQLSLEQLAEVFKHFFPNPSEEKPDELKSTQNSGKTTKSNVKGQS